MRKKIKKIIHRLQIKKLEKQAKVFCISVQKTGTTSTGKFFKDIGLRSIGFGGSKDNDWSRLWLEDDYEQIFNSTDFRTANAYEDSPWWFPDFYKIIDKEFPESRFVLLERDYDKWFDSMLTHAGGRVSNILPVHCKVYNRQNEFNQLLKKGLISQKDLYSKPRDWVMKITEDHRQHYIECYKTHTKNALDYFKDQPNKLFHGKLEDEDVWQNLASFLDVQIDSNYKSVQNTTINSKRRQSFINNKS